MKTIPPDSISKSKLRQWIEELTDYTPQQVDKVMEHLQESCNPA